VFRHLIRLGFLTDRSAAAQSVGVGVDAAASRLLFTHLDRERQPSFRP
jgi:hypothetical protein